jgi:cytochrome c-type biogenesis protein CcmH/NrfF
MTNSTPDSPAVPRNTWWLLATLFVSMLVLTGVSMAISSVNQTRMEKRIKAEQQAREEAIAEQNRVTRLVWCAIALPIAERAETTPPSSPAGQQQLELARQLIAAYHC